MWKLQKWQCNRRRTVKCFLFSGKVVLDKTWKLFFATGTALIRNVRDRCLSHLLSTIINMPVLENNKIFPDLLEINCCPFLQLRKKFQKDLNSSHWISLWHYSIISQAAFWFVECCYLLKEVFIHLHILMWTDCKIACSQK